MFPLVFWYFFVSQMWIYWIFVSFSLLFDCLMPFLVNIFNLFFGVFVFEVCIPSDRCIKEMSWKIYFQQLCQQTWTLKGQWENFLPLFTFIHPQLTQFKIFRLPTPSFHTPVFWWWFNVISLILLIKMKYITLTSLIFFVHLISFGSHFLCCLFFITHESGE